MAPIIKVKAKRGDLVLVKTTASASYVSGKRVEKVSWELGLVTSVSRVGLVKGYTAFPAWGGESPRRTEIGFVESFVIKADTLEGDAREIALKIRATLGENAELETVEQARRFLTPWRAAEPRIVAWPNGIGWDVDGHHVVREPSGVYCAALVELPDGAPARVQREADISGQVEPPAAFLRGLVRSCFASPAPPPAITDSLRRDDLRA